MSTPHPSIPPQIDQLDHSSGTPQQEHEPVHGEKPEKTFREVRNGFFIHLTVYVLVNALLVYLDLSKPEDGYWVQWVLGGWGIGVFFHGLAVYLKWKREKSSNPA
jgi:hypothetical protein